MHGSSGATPTQPPRPGARMAGHPPPPPRSHKLDALRAVAVLLVLGAHASGWIQSPPWPLPTAFDLWRRAGWAGVDLFFVLSGFLVSGLLFREHNRWGRLSVSRFLLRRGLKIYPGYYVLLGLSILYFHQAGPEATAFQIASEALFFQNYGRPLWAHTWSLAVEEHFYLLLAAFLAFLARRGGPGEICFRPVLGVAAAVATLSLGARWWTDYAYPPAATPNHFDWSLRHVFPTHLRLDTLLLGVALSYVNHYHHDRVNRFVTRWFWALAVASAAMVVPVLATGSLQSRWVYTFGFTLAAIGFALTLLLTIHSSRLDSRPLAILIAPLAWVGYYSYSIYLWHVPYKSVVFPHVLGAFPDLTYVATQAIYVGGSIVWGVAMAMLIELPVLRARDRWFPSRS